jgi:hypothetical protein
MNSFHFPVKGVSGFSLIISEAFDVIVVVAMVLAIVFFLVSVSVLFVVVSKFWSQCRGICYDFEQCICDKPVLAFGTEQITIVNSRRLSSQRSQRSVLVEFDELHKECLLRKRYCLSEFESEVYQSRLTKF